MSLVFISWLTQAWSLGKMRGFAYTPVLGRLIDLIGLGRGLGI